jgi:general secretion pathway protein G
MQYLQLHAPTRDRPRSAAAVTRCVAVGVPAEVHRRAGGASQRTAFTLVEMLAVITILGILASLISVAVVAAKKKIAVMKVTNEIRGLETALAAWKARFGEYPPDLAGVRDNAANPLGNVDSDPTNYYNNGTATTQTFTRATLFTHLQTAFPRYSWAATWYVMGGNGPYGFAQSMITARVDPALLDPSTALVLWLGGMPVPNSVDSSGNITSVLKQLNGLSTNPGNPFDNNANRIAPFFQFDTARLRAIYLDSNNMPQPQTSWPATNLIAFQYLPDLPTSGPTPQPYIYFSARSNYAWAVPNNSGRTVAARGYDPRFQYWPTYESSYTISEIANTLSNGAITPTKYTIHVRPYFHLSPGKGINEWFNSDTCQIICAGLDGLYGAISVDSPDGGTNQTARSNPGVPYAPTYTDNLGNGMVGNGHFDNITNLGVIEDIP